MTPADESVYVLLLSDSAVRWRQTDLRHRAHVQRPPASGRPAEEGQQQAAPRLCHRDHLEVLRQAQQRG